MLQHDPDSVKKYISRLNDGSWCEKTKQAEATNINNSKTKNV